MCPVSLTGTTRLPSMTPCSSLIPLFLTSNEALCTSFWTWFFCSPSLPFCIPKKTGWLASKRQSVVVKSSGARLKPAWVWILVLPVLSQLPPRLRFSSCQMGKLQHLPHRVNAYEVLNSSLHIVSTREMLAFITHALTRTLPPSPCFASSRSFSISLPPQLTCQRHQWTRICYSIPLRPMQDT